MAKQRYQQQKKPVASKPSSRNDMDRCYLVARKLLRHFGLEPSLIDVFTKKQKEKLLHKFYETPSIKAAKERTVPRQYVKNINTDIFKFMKTHYWGDPEIGISYMELATYGLSFLSNIEYTYESNRYPEGSPQWDAAAKICAKFNRDDVLNTAFKPLFDEVWFLTRSYSRVNYRMYGFDFDCDKRQLPCGCCCVCKLIFRLTAQDSETKVFSHNNIPRKAFRMFDTADGLYLPKPAQIFQKAIYPDVEDDREFNIYVQSHAINRFKERMNVFGPSVQNILFQYSFTRGLSFVTLDGHELFACVFNNEYNLGYFTFFVRGDDIVINTFLPLLNQFTPEGKKLHERLPLGKDKMAFLGMDRLNFFSDVDYDQVPLLKQALIDAGIWATKQEIDEYLFDEEKGCPGRPLDNTKTAIVKKFFQADEVVVEATE